MVCDRCIMAVGQVLEDLQLNYRNLHLGEVELVEEPGREQLQQLSERLNNKGFELLDDKKSQLVEKVKTVIVSLIHGSEKEFNMKLSALLEEKLNVDYHYITTLFSSVEGLTIEKYAILQRIEKVKELLMYNEMNLSEIAEQMGYSSVQHLSQQFKKVTGMTPSGFRSLKENRRKPIDRLGA